MGIHYTVLQQKRGRGREWWRTGRSREWQNYDRDDMKIGKQRRNNHKIMEERKQGSIVGRMGGGEAGRLERMSETPFWTRSGECAVTFHYLWGAAEMQFSYGYLLCSHLHSPTKTSHSFLFLSLKYTHPRACFSPSPPFLTLNLIKKKGWGNVNALKLVQMYFSSRVKHALSDDAPLLRDGLLYHLHVQSSPSLIGSVELAGDLHWQCESTACSEG